MMNKYHGQVQDIDESIQLGIRQKKPKTRLLGELRKKKIILHAMAKCQKQIDTVTQRRYAVEQLNITSMQIDALKETAGIFRDVMSQASLTKIEKLQDTMEQLSDDLVDINDALEQNNIDFDDDDLEDELQSLLQPKQQVVSTQEIELLPLGDDKNANVTNEEDGWGEEEEEHNTVKKELVSW